MEEEVRVESEVWVALMVVARSLGRRVAVEEMVRKSRQRAGLKDDVVGVLEQGYQLF